MLISCALSSRPVRLKVSPIGHHICSHRALRCLHIDIDVDIDVDIDPGSACT